MKEKKVLWKAESTACHYLSNEHCTNMFCDNAGEQVCKTCCKSCDKFVSVSDYEDKAEVVK